MAGQTLVGVPFGDDADGFPIHDERLRGMASGTSEMHRRCVQDLAIVTVWKNHIWSRI